jgi:dihydrolipoamide dehydrogenase
MSNYDVIIVGSGPGGYVTAIRAAQLGLKTAIVEREHLGGICLNWGCIPTKALLRSAEMASFAKRFAEYGLKLDGKVTPDLAKIIERSRGASARLNAGVDYLMKKNGIDVIWGEAKLAGKGKVEVKAPSKKPMQPQHPMPKGVAGPGSYSAKHIILATGARPRALPGLEPDGKLIWTYFEAMVPETLPKKLLVMGSGAIGIEFASFYNAMGADVTVVEVMDRIMPVEDAEISGIARNELEKHGLTIHTGAKVTKVAKGKDSLKATVEMHGKTQVIEADRMISAVGVQGNIDGLGLEALGVKTDRGCVVTDGFGATNVPGIYAIGDVAGPPMLAHKAEHEGVLCVEKIAGIKCLHPMDISQIPGCTYCHPQVASVGQTEAAAVEALTGHEGLTRDEAQLVVGMLCNPRALAKGWDASSVACAAYIQRVLPIVRRAASAPSSRRRTLKRPDLEEFLDAAKKRSTKPTDFDQRRDFCSAVVEGKTTWELLAEDSLGPGPHKPLHLKREKVRLQRLSTSFRIEVNRELEARWKAWIDECTKAGREVEPKQWTHLSTQWRKELVELFREHYGGRHKPARGGLKNP